MNIPQKSAVLLSAQFLLAALLTPAVSAQVSREEVLSAYRSYKEVQASKTMPAPAVIEVPFGNEYIERLDFAVFDATSNSFEPYAFQQQILAEETPVWVDALIPDAFLMQDKDATTYADFPLPETLSGNAAIELKSDEPIVSSALTVLFDNHVSFPSSVEVRAVVNGEERILLAASRMTGNTIRFPRTVSDHWLISFTFAQPLRISELQLQQENVERQNLKTVRFLAKPGHIYRVYYDTDRRAYPPIGEAGNLRSATGVLVWPMSPGKKNFDYRPADVDKDGVYDASDNCVDVKNPDQKDVNLNYRGDACDDFDWDGVLNSNDNCVDDPNRDQRDEDGDIVGDVCDPSESRITEKYPWFPWLGVGFAGLVLIGLFAITAASPAGNKT